MKFITTADIQSNSDKLNPQQTASFSFPNQITPVVMNVGDTLWRFYSHQNGSIFSDCWLDQDTMTNLMSIFRSWNDFSEETKKGVVKDNLAILNNWSKLNWRMKVVFKKSVVAHKGIIAPQNGYEKSNQGISKLITGAHSKAVEFRVGGMTQYVIPSFKGLDVKKAEEFVSIVHKAHI